MKKKKVFVLMVSKYFPATHPRAGERTDFIHKILATFNKAVVDYSYEGYPIVQERENTERLIGFDFNSKGDVYNKQTLPPWTPKIHTIRANYDLWAKRAEQINRGVAVLSLRQWSGRPYRSKQEEFLVLSRICVQPIQLLVAYPIIKGHEIVATIHDIQAIEFRHIKGSIVAKNDGLSTSDFYEWFKDGFGGCVIHFTENFKY